LAADQVKERDSATVKVTGWEKALDPVTDWEQVRGSEMVWGWDWDLDSVKASESVSR